MSTGEFGGHAFPHLQQMFLTLLGRQLGGYSLIIQLCSASLGTRCLNAYKEMNLRNSCVGVGVFYLFGGGGGRSQGVVNPVSCIGPLHPIAYSTY